MNRYDTNSKGTSPALSALINQFSKMPRSAFDETRRKSFDAAPFAIIPFECFLMFPNSEGYIRYSPNCISKNPTIKRILSSMNIEIRTYKAKCSDLWEGWNNFITKGRTGKVDLQIPTLDVLHTGSGATYTTALPYNPLHYLNIAPAVKYNANQSFDSNQGIINITNSNYKDTGLLGSSFNLTTSETYNKGINSLPMVLYCKIAKEFQNPNLLQGNPYWYPENENHDLILPYNATHATNACYDACTEPYGYQYEGEYLNKVQPTNDVHSMPWLNVLYYKQRKGNYFNTGSPFPDLLRGDIPTLDILSANADFTAAVMPGTNDLVTQAAVGLQKDTNDNDKYKLTPGSLTSQTETWDPAGLRIAHNEAIPGLKNADLLSLLNSNTIKQVKFSLNQWRRLATMTIFRERMARTDGSYNQMIQAQFQHNPNWHEHSAIYCGGMYQPIVFSEVVQQSADSSTPLGTQAGRAVSSGNSDQIYVKADDYTIFMSVLTITPDDYYSQGIDRMWSELTQSEQYFPILNNLEPQAIKNKELFLSGTDSDDEDIFNYQELFSHFKSRQNQVSGLLSLPISEVGDTGAFIFNRLFTSKPEFNNAFVTGKFTSNENLAFASTEQAQFVFDIACEFKYVAPMPAVTQPSDMGISY